MRKSIFDIVFKLHKKQPWLAEKHDEVSTLLFEDCKDDNQQDLIIELLDRFIYLDDSKFNDALTTLCDEIVTDPSLESDQTQIVSFSADNSPDSGQYILYALKPRLEKREWRNHISVNRYGASFKEFNRHGGVHKKIVLVDEFIGSGQSAIGRFNELRRIYERQGIVDIYIKIFVIAASTVGLEKLRQENIPVTYIYEIKRGISDFYDNKEKKENLLTIMDILEKTLSQNYKGRDLPKNGYGETESLYARSEGNTPNSVFPIFWWPIYLDERSRKTLLTRAMGDA
ncbi:TPA: hypothetical protein ACOEB2_002957 [Enterobacter cloacae]